MCKVPVYQAESSSASLDRYPHFKKGFFEVVFFIMPEHLYL